MRHSTISYAGDDEDEIGDLSLDKISNPSLCHFGLIEDKPFLSTPANPNIRSDFESGEPLPRPKENNSFQLFGPHRTRLFRRVQRDARQVHRSE